MTDSEQKANVRIGHSIRAATAVAIGSCVTVGLGVYLLLGPVYSAAGSQTPVSYLLPLFFLLPLLLALAERASVTPGRGGLFNLSRAAGSLPLAFSSGWLVLGGLFGLASLFAWEGGLALGQLISLFFSIEIEGRWLGGLLVILVLLRSISQPSGIWKRRTTAVYFTLFLLLVILFAAWFAPIQIPNTWISLPSGSFLSAVPYLAIFAWSLHFVLDRRDELQRPRISTLLALGLPILLGGTIGAAAAATMLLFPSLTYLETLPLVTLAGQISPLLVVLVLLAMLIIGIIGTNESLSSLMKLSSALQADGFLPAQLQLRHRRWKRPFFTRLLFVTATSILVLFVSFDTVVAQTAIAVFLVSILVNLQDILRSRSRLPANRWPKLPFHPLVPGLAVAFSLTFILTLNVEFLLSFLPWFTAGAVVYIIYARDGAIAVRQRDALVTGTILPAKNNSFRVMVAISDPSKADSLIELGTEIATAHNGLLVVLQVGILADDEATNQQRASLAWQKLNDIIPATGLVSEIAIPLVRLSTDAAHGILATVWEEKIDLLLLGWPTEHAAGVEERDGTLGQIVRKAKCQVVILHGTWQGPANHVLVPLLSAGHSPAALSLGQDLSSTQADEGRVIALRVLPGKLTDEKRLQEEAQLHETVDGLDDSARIEGKVAAYNNKTKGIIQEAESYDALLLGLSEEGFLAQTDFGGLPVEVAVKATPPTLLVKRQEKAFQYWLRRSWDQLTAVLPILSRKRRALVGAEMRRDARADIDFYVLMVLAAAIALFGLLQDSAAVIIGAMLVAPLMSPILAMAHSIVRGQLKMLREAAESAANGIVLAIAVGAILSLMLVVLGIPIPPTDEILARTEPNFLDLLVALASGAAAAYAISRSEVSAALPGVAIAAALVPPLAVVGYGLGTAQFDLAAGSMLLFLTNLAAIVLAAAIVFLLLGFRPPARDDRDEQARFGLKMAVVAMVIIAIPLFATTRISANQAAQARTAALVLQQQWPPSQAQVVDIVVTSEPKKGLVVTCTIFDYAGVVTDEALAELQVILSNSLDEPVELQARTIDAQLTSHNATSAARLLTMTPTATVTPTPILPLTNDPLSTITALPSLPFATDPRATTEASQLETRLPQLTRDLSTVEVVQPGTAPAATPENPAATAIP